MQQMVVNRMMFGAAMFPPPDFYLNVPPPPLPIHPFQFPSPPPPPPSTTPSSLLMNVSNTPPAPSASPASPASPALTASPAPSPALSYSTYYAPSPELLDVDGIPAAVSPSVFIGWEQDGQDQWHTPQASPAVSDIYDPDDDNARMDIYINVPNIADDDTVEFNYEVERRERERERERAVVEVNRDDNNGDDDVIFVTSYQRSDDDQQPIRDERLNEAELRANRLQQLLDERMRRTSCPVCYADMLDDPTLLFPCGHLCCLNCTIQIENRVNLNTFQPDTRCPTCREESRGIEYCQNVFFP